MIAQRSQENHSYTVSHRPLILPPLPDYPKVSVIMANFNYGHYIRDAIDSVTNQTYQNFEICICDDGSTDNSKEIIESAARSDNRIKFIFQNNSGAGCALNSAFAISTGEIVAFLDADDVWLPERLKLTLERFRSNTTYGLVAHPLRQVNADLTLTINPSSPAEIDEGWHGANLLSGRAPSLPPCSGLSLRREIALKVFPINPAFRSLADGVFRVHAALLTSVGTIQWPLGLMRIHGNNVTTKAPDEIEIKELQQTVSGYRRQWDERRAFIAREFNVQLPDDHWYDECLPKLLAEQLLLRSKPPFSLIARVASPRERRIWTFLFSCPLGTGGLLLRHFWWRKSKLKLFLKRALLGKQRHCGASTE